VLLAGATDVYLVVRAPNRVMQPDRQSSGALGGREASADKWINDEFQPSTLSRAEQVAELQWFIVVGEALRANGIEEIKVASKSIPTHEYESRTLASAFEQITGIKVKHELITELEVTERLQVAIQSGKSPYDGWIASSDLLGTYYRGSGIVSLSGYMASAGKSLTNPTLDLKDFIGASFATAPDGQLYQLPDQQFASLYWYRADLFARKDLQDRFKSKYGYNLAIPVNWSAYEDIARFFTDDVKSIDGKPIYGHMDYGKRESGAGWNFSDAWLSTAGTGDIGIPNGLPVDEWGIRVGSDKCTPVGASVSRGGATNSPATVFALTTYVDWLKKYAPKSAAGMTLAQAETTPAQGEIAQQLSWYTSFAPELTKIGLPVVNTDGTPKWRVAPGPSSPYWKPGMQSGYQDVGSWTFLKSTDADRTAAAWLYAQFTTSKTVSLKKSIVGLTFIRDSDIHSAYFTQNAARFGGLIEFYRSPARVAWTPNGSNAPDYPAFAQLWGKNVAIAINGEKTPQQAMDNLAEEMDQVMGRLQRAGMPRCAPRLNPKTNPNNYLSDTGSPWKKLANERPKGETIDYDVLINGWKAGKVR
jgi:glycerol transport system substrate-binding protein